VTQKRRGGQTATRWEWISAAIGAVVTLATIGYLVYEGVSRPSDRSPRLIVAVESIVPEGDGWAVRIEARNAGTATAAAVRIVGELRADSGVVETSEVTLDYVPEASSRTGALLFTRDPSGLELTVRPTGYELP
jgi:uncharacterized protein (TIGR02588 family)